MPKKPKKPLNINGLYGIGAAGGDRTHDPWLRRPILYPLSYSRNAELILSYAKQQMCRALLDASRHQRWILTVDLAPSLKA